MIVNKDKTAEERIALLEIEVKKLGFRVSDWQIEYSPRIKFEEDRIEIEAVNISVTFEGRLDDE